MQTHFSVSHKGQEIGPYTRDEILQKVRTSELSALDFVFVSERNDWVPLLEFLPEAAKVRAADKHASKDASVTQPKQPPKQPPTKIPPRTPPPKAAPQATAEPTPEAKRGTVSLKNGVGSIELLQYTAGTIKLAVLSDGKHGLKVETPHELVVKAAPAVKFALKGPAEVVVGQPATIVVEAQDKWGNRDTAFAGTVTAQLSSTAETEIKLAGGRGALQFTSKKAETISIRLADSAKSGLDSSASWDVKYVAGPPARLILSSPEETVAGQSVKIHVKAIDEFGNVATNCNEDVLLEVTAALQAAAAADAAKKAS